MPTPNLALACDFGIASCGGGCSWHTGRQNLNGEMWIAIRKDANTDRLRRVARRSPYAPSLKLHAADYGLAPVRAWGMTDRAVETHRLARTILALCRRQGSTPFDGDTAWGQAVEIMGSKARRARIAARVAAAR